MTVGFSDHAPAIITDRRAVHPCELFLRSTVARPRLIPDFLKSNERISAYEVTPSVLMLAQIFPLRERVAKITSLREIVAIVNSFFRKQEVIENYNLLDYTAKLIPARATQWPG